MTYTLDSNTKIEDTKSVLVMYNKSKLKPLGKCKLKLRNPRNQLEFQVVDKGDTVPLLGKIGRNVKHEKSFRK